MSTQPDATMGTETEVERVFTSAAFPRTHPITTPRTATMAVIEDEFRAATMRQLRAMIAAEEPTPTTPAEWLRFFFTLSDGNEDPQAIRPNHRPIIGYHQSPDIN